MAELATATTYNDLNRRFRWDELGDLARVHDLDSVSQAIDTILLWPLGTRKFLPDFGSTLSSLLFEPIDPATVILIQNEVRRAINRWEPRITITNISAIPDEDSNTYHLTVVGYVEGLDDFTYQRTLSRD